MTSSFILARFPGSTLEPSSEPIVIYESHYYTKNAGRALHIDLIPTRSTPPLKRLLKPPPIVIPKFDITQFHPASEDNPPSSSWSFHDSSATSTVAST